MDANNNNNILLLFIRLILIIIKIIKYGRNRGVKKLDR